MYMKVWATEEMIEMAREGYSASTIKDVLKLSCTVRHIQRLIQPYRPVRPVPERVSGDHLSAVMRDIITQLLVEKGHHPKICGVCGLPQYRDCDIHHLKYEGATLDDLVFACRKCNNAPANVGLV